MRSFLQQQEGQGVIQKGRKREIRNQRQDSHSFLTQSHKEAGTRCLKRASQQVKYRSSRVHFKQAHSLGHWSYPLQSEREREKQSLTESMTGWPCMLKVCQHRSEVTALEINGDAVHTLHRETVGFQSPCVLFMSLSGSKFEAPFTLTVIKSLEVTKLLSCWLLLDISTQLQ